LGLGERDGRDPRFLVGFVAFVVFVAFIVFVALVAFVVLVALVVSRNSITTESSGFP
jgi:hypothetical protein